MYTMVIQINDKEISDMTAELDYTKLLHLVWLVLATVRVMLCLEISFTRVKNNAVTFCDFKR